MSCGNTSNHTAVAGLGGAPTEVGLNDGLLPLLDREGFFNMGWQVIASETATNYANFPVGFMRWKPVSEGPKYQDWVIL